MALASGLNAQWGMINETNYGFVQTVSKFLPVISEKIDKKIDRIESKSIYAGRRVLDSTQYAPGNIAVAGNIETELYDHGQGWLWRWCMGGVSITGSGTYTAWTFTPNDLALTSATMQFGRPNSSGSSTPFTYSGVKVDKWTVKAAVNQIATMSLSVVGQNETTGIALATASYPSNLLPYTFVHGAVTVAGTSVSVKNIDIHGDNKLANSRRFLNSSTISEPLEADLRDYGGQFVAEFTDLTQYNRFINNSTGALSLVFTSGSNTLTFTTNIRHDGETPNVAGRGILDQPVKFKCHGTNDAAAITIVAVNTDSTN